MSAAMAFPQDEVLPETSATLSQLSENHPELKHATPKDAAHAKIKMLQDQGFDNTQCNQLATDAITGMTSALKAEQDTMTALSTGADCLVTTPATRRLLGIAAQQQLLDDAAAALVLAKADLATKETALATASSAPVSITMTLDTIGTNMAAIGQAVSLDSAVVSAKAAVVTAQAVKDAATLVVVADQASFDTASTAAQDASQECLCNAKAAHDTAWPNAQKVVTDNTQAWKEAHHVKCALDGTADDACSVPPFTVTNTVLVTEAADVVCKKVCTVSYTRHQSQIRGDWTSLTGAGLIPTKPPCVSNDDWTPPFCRAGKYPQSLAIGAERCKVACDARPECTGMGIRYLGAQAALGTTTECYLAGTDNSAKALISHSGWDFYDRAETCKYTKSTCLNSNGIDGFDVSHDGWFFTGHVLQGTTTSDAACADICRADASCTAFSRNQQNSACFNYAARGKQMMNSNDHAYIRCV